MRDWKRSALVETILLVLLFYAYAGDRPPMVNEAHYLVKAKNFWQPELVFKPTCLLRPPKRTRHFYAIVRLANPRYCQSGGNRHMDWHDW